MAEIMCCLSTEYLQALNLWSRDFHTVCNLSSFLRTQDKKKLLAEAVHASGILSYPLVSVNGIAFFKKVI